MQPHELKPLKHRLSAMKAITRPERIARRITTARRDPIDLSRVRWPSSSRARTTSHTHDGERVRRQRARERQQGVQPTIGWIP